MESQTDTARARQLIRERILTIAANDLVAMPHPGWGGDSDAFLVDHRWIFRFPRSREIRRRLAVEVCLLPRLARRVRLPIPSFRYVVPGDEGLPFFVGYEAIPGEPLRRSHLETIGRRTLDRLARQLGTFLRELHGTPVEDAIECGVAPPREEARERWERVRENMRHRVFPVLSAEERRWVERRFDAFLAEPRLYQPRATLCHGDLSGDHILYDASPAVCKTGSDGMGNATPHSSVDGASGHLSGVIDFGDVCIGDPAGDFVWRDEYGEEFFREALASYGHPEDTLLPERVTFCLDRMALGEIGYGIEIGCESYVVEGRERLRQRMSAEG